MDQPKKTAVITGITGQDGAYLTELLLHKGYRVYGTYRRTSSVNFWRLEELGVASHPNLALVEYDLTDLSSTIRLLQISEATEVYNLAAQSFVGVSFEQPITRRKSPESGQSTYWRLFALLTPRFVFIRHLLQRCSARCWRSLRMKARPFTPAAPTGWQNYTPIG